MDIRDGAPADVPMLARLHVQAWAETYTGILPQAEHAAHGLDFRLGLWTRIMAQPHPQVAIAPHLGFAQVGPQRDQALTQAGYPQELYCLYLLSKAHGTGIGLGLLKHALGAAPQPFSACVLDQNARACAFYEKTGGHWLDTRDEMIGQTTIRERVYVWGSPVHLPD